MTEFTIAHVIAAFVGGIVGSAGMSYALFKRQRINAIGHSLAYWFKDHFTMPYDGERMPRMSKQDRIDAKRVGMSDDDIRGFPSFKAAHEARTDRRLEQHALHQADTFAAIKAGLGVVLDGDIKHDGLILSYLQSVDCGFPHDARFIAALAHHFNGRSIPAPIANRLSIQNLATIEAIKQKLNALPRSIHERMTPAEIAEYEKNGTIPYVSDREPRGAKRQTYEEVKLSHSRKIEAVLPAKWAQLLVYGDRSQINDDELSALSLWLAKHGLRMVDIHHVKNDEHWAKWHAAWGEWPVPGVCQTFVFYSLDDSVKGNLA